MVPKIRNVVVGVDSARGSDPVLEAAIAFAGSFGATLHVVHGYMLTDPLLDAYARAGYLGEHTIANFGRELQSGLEARIAEVADAADVRVRAIAGPPVTALLDVAAEVDADVVVVGSTRHGTFPLSLLGSTCRAVLRRSPRPVLVLRPNRPPIPRRVLAPTDLSAYSSNAFAWGLALAGHVEGSEVRALLVINESLMLLPLEQRLLERVAEEELAEFTQKAGEAEAPPDRVVRKGDPSTEIVAEVKEWGADLLVLGTHARKGMERVLLGSVAESALKTAPCHVLVVPPDAKAPGSGSDRAGGESVVRPDTSVPPAV
jgi:nucleotide-binding universal stress UspA family protein